MPRIRFPRRSSLQYWPRSRANKQIARMRNWPETNNVKPLGFAGYKVGMTHAMMQDNRPNSLTKGTELPIPLTIIECPPIKVIGIRTYNKDAYGFHAFSQILAQNLDKDIIRSLILPKKQKKTVDDLKPEGTADVKLIVATQPGLTSIGKKKPEIFELAIGTQKTTDKLAYAKTILGKEINLNEIFTEGGQVDTHAITKGKGVQGPVKRHGVNIRHHKSEKTKRGPGSLGPWHGTLNWPVAHQGQTGYQQRTEFNKWIIKISNDPTLINPKGGWIRYGLVKNNYLLLKGSVGGPSKRLITLTLPIRVNKKVSNQAPQLTWISLESKQ